jgi:hypothetical protein
MCRQLAALTHIRRMVTERSTQVGTTRDIREAVEAELAFDPLVDAADIIVKNMGGEVALHGTVPSDPQYLQAAAAAQRVAGVRNVHNRLEVVLPPGDYWDDAMLTTSAINALEAECHSSGWCPGDRLGRQHHAGRHGELRQQTGRGRLRRRLPDRRPQH